MNALECTRWNEPVTIRKTDLLRTQKYQLVLSAAQLTGDDPE
jgi:hypothetical protein